MLVQYTRNLILVAMLLLAACGTTAEPAELPTPTPLPPDPALERPTFTVKRGPIERVLEVTGRATPIDLVRLAFKRDGRIKTVFVQRGDSVKAGDVIAELEQEEALDDLRQSQDDVVQAERALAEAAKIQARTIKERELDLQQAREALARLLPGGEADQLKEAQDKLEEAERDARQGSADRSWAKTTAEDALRARAEALEDAQKAYSKAKWDLDWVEKYGTHPTERVPSPGNPDVLIPRKLSDEEKKAFADAVITAERNLRAAERALEEAQRALDKVRDDERVGNEQASQKVDEARKVVQTIQAGKGSKEQQEARRAIDQAQIALDEARQKTLTTETKAVENAKRALDRAQRKVDDGRVTAPQDGDIIAIALEEGATVTAFDPIIELADASKLEFSATLSGEQMRQLAEGQPAEIRLLTRPDLVLPSVIRRMPAPYGSGGSGSVQDRDQTTRFEILDMLGQTLTPGASLAKIRLVLEQKASVLLLPPEAIRSFEGRRFVLVREGERERRVTVQIGITTDLLVEIVDGLKEGDLVIGQ